MKLATLLLLLAATALASPPRCKTVVQGETTFEVCSRADASCLATVTKFIEEKADNWEKKLDWLLVGRNVLQIRV